jgi:hypothetical protein
MICWRVCDVVKRFVSNSDDVLRNCKVVHALDREWKLLLRPAEHNLPNLTPFWANRNFGADSSCRQHLEAQGEYRRPLLPLHQRRAP